MNPKKVQVKALRGFFGERSWNWWWWCPRHRAGLPCEDWETAVSWALYHVETMHQKEHR